MKFKIFLNEYKQLLVDKNNNIKVLILKKSRIKT